MPYPKQTPSDLQATVADSENNSEKKNTILNYILKDYPEIYKVCLKKYKAHKRGKIQDLQQSTLQNHDTGVIELYYNRHIAKAEVRQFEVTLNRIFNDDGEKKFRFVFLRPSPTGKVYSLGQPHGDNIYSMQGISSQGISSKEKLSLYEKQNHSEDEKVFTPPIEKAG